MNLKRVLELDPEKEVDQIPVGLSPHLLRNGGGTNPVEKRERERKTEERETERRRENTRGSTVGLI